MVDLLDLEGVSCVKNPGSCINGFTVSIVLKIDKLPKRSTTVMLSTAQGFLEEGVQMWVKG